MNERTKDMIYSAIALGFVGKRKRLEEMFFF